MPENTGKPSLPSNTRKAAKAALPTDARKTAKPSLPPGMSKAAKPSLPPGAGRGRAPKRTLETIKSESGGLRGSLPEDLKAEKDHFDEAGRQVLKFHGIYQQDDRDCRKGGREYMFMVRSRIPAGIVTPEQYLVHDELADRYGNGTLRITTRQGFQLHGVLKGELKPTLRAINEALLTTLAACGDVTRNIMCTPAPPTEPYHHDVQAVIDRLGDHLLPKTRAYHDVWLDGEKVYSGRDEAAPNGEAASTDAEGGPEEPLYGKAYLPRKFKVGVAYPGDNSVDVYTQDVGHVAIVEDGKLRGFNVLAGGGLGMTHNKPETYPRLADAIGFAPTEKVVDVVEKIVLIQRDHGNRKDRRHARLKYLIDDWGLDRFQAELNERLGYTLQPPSPAPPMELDLYLGWREQADDRWYLGLSVENGRIDGKLKAALRAVVEGYRPTLRLTPNHNVLLTDIDRSDRDGIDALLAEFGVASPGDLTNARTYSMACPALPTCGLALAESERVMPDLINEFDKELGRLGLQDEVLGIRMTGCPNGCARPYVSEIGIVGRSLDQYMLFLGGSTSGTRLNEPFRDLVALNEIVPTLRPIFLAFKEERTSGERFGDYCHRIGIHGLKDRAERYADYAEAS